MKRSATSAQTPRVSLFFPPCSPFFDRSGRGCSSFKCFIQRVLLPEKKKKEKLGWGTSFASHTGEKILQKIPGDFPSMSRVRDIGTHALPLALRRALLQGSHTFSLLGERWALPAKEGECLLEGCMAAPPSSLPTATATGSHWTPVF